MCKEQDLGIARITQYIRAGKKVNKAQIGRIKLKIVHRYLLQFDRLGFQQKCCIGYLNRKGLMVTKYCYLQNLEPR